MIPEAAALRRGRHLTPERPRPLPGAVPVPRRPNPGRSTLPPRHIPPTSLKARRQALHRRSPGLTRTAAWVARTGRSLWPLRPRHCCLGCSRPARKVALDRNCPRDRAPPRFAATLAGLIPTGRSLWPRRPRHCCLGCSRPARKVALARNCPRDRAPRRFAETLVGLARIGRWPRRLHPGHCRFACCSPRPPARLSPAAAKGPARAMSGLGRHPGSLRPPTDRPGAWHWPRMRDRSCCRAECRCHRRSALARHRSVRLPREISREMPPVKPGSPLHCRP